MNEFAQINERVWLLAGDSVQEQIWSRVGDGMCATIDFLVYEEVWNHSACQLRDMVEI